MKIQLPELEYSSDPAAVQANRDAIASATAAAKAALKALDGLREANQGLCKHPHKITSGRFGDDVTVSCNACGGSW